METKTNRLHPLVCFRFENLGRYRTEISGQQRQESQGVHQEAEDENVIDRRVEETWSNGSRNQSTSKARWT